MILFIVSPIFAIISSPANIAPERYPRSSIRWVLRHWRQWAVIMTLFFNESIWHAISYSVYYIYRSLCKAFLVSFVGWFYFWHILWSICVCFHQLSIHTILAVGSLEISCAIVHNHFLMLKTFITISHCLLDMHRLCDALVACLLLAQRLCMLPDSMDVVVFADNVSIRFWFWPKPQKRWSILKQD